MSASLWKIPAYNLEFFAIFDMSLIKNFHKVFLGQFSSFEALISYIYIYIAFEGNLSHFPGYISSI